MGEAVHTERLEAALDGKYRIERELGSGAMGVELGGRLVVQLLAFEG